AKATPASSPAKNLTLGEGRARAQAAKESAQKQVEEGAAKKRASEEGEEEGAVSETIEISNDLDEQQERYQAAQLQGAPEVTSSAPSTAAYPRGYYPADEVIGSPMFLEKLSTPLVF
ncbi:Hypothetical protein PHPALM_7609, partial [Phytophthora palmivora]